LSFGEKERLLNNMLISNIIPIGSFYLDFLLKSFSYNKRLKNIIKDYKIVIGISMQDSEWERELVFNFLNKVSSLNSDILYILIPRQKMSFPKIADNVYISYELDCYITIMHCNIHMTLYSSCALEAPSLGIPNILLDLHSIVKEYYKDILNPYHTKYVKNYEDLNLAIKSLMKLNKEEIIRANQKVFYSNYKERIENFMHKYIIGK